MLRLDPALLRIAASLIARAFLLLGAVLVLLLAILWLVGKLQSTRSTHSVSRKVVEERASAVLPSASEDGPALRDSPEAFDRIPPAGILPRRLSFSMTTPRTVPAVTGRPEIPNHKLRRVTFNLTASQESRERKAEGGTRQVGTPYRSPGAEVSAHVGESPCPVVELFPARSKPTPLGHVSREFGGEVLRNRKDPTRINGLEQRRERSLHHMNTASARSHGDGFEGRRPYMQAAPQAHDNLGFSAKPVSSHGRPPLQPALHRPPVSREYSYGRVAGGLHPDRHVPQSSAGRTPRFQGVDRNQDRYSDPREIGLPNAPAFRDTRLGDADAKLPGAVSLLGRDSATERLHSSTASGEVSRFQRRAMMKSASREPDQVRGFVASDQLRCSDDADESPASIVPQEATETVSLGGNSRLSTTPGEGKRVRFSLEGDIPYSQQRVASAGRPSSTSILRRSGASSKTASVCSGTVARHQFPREACDDLSEGERSIVDFLVMKLLAGNENEVDNYLESIPADNLRNAVGFLYYNRKAESVPRSA